jgi:hypothetical protein
MAAGLVGLGGGNSLALWPKRPFASGIVADTWDTYLPKEIRILLRI